MLTIINPYYDNPGMLERQLRQWNSYSPEVKEKLQVIVVDDCSPNYPARDVIFEWNDDRLTERWTASDIYSFNLYRIEENVRWNWLMCRNLGAYQADFNNWLFLTDIDHVIPEDTMNYLFFFMGSGKADKRKFYIPNRVDAPNLTPYKRHPNSYFMHREAYWIIGGYDEEYSGNYGTDGMYRRRAVEKLGEGLLLDCPTIRYPREVIPDASTTEFRRKEGRDPKKLKNIYKKKKAEGREDHIQTLSFPWERLI